MPLPGVLYPTALTLPLPLPLHSCIPLHASVATWTPSNYLQLPHIQLLLSGQALATIVQNLCNKHNCTVSDHWTCRLDMSPWPSVTTMMSPSLSRHCCQWYCTYPHYAIIDRLTTILIRALFTSIFFNSITRYQVVEAPLMILRENNSIYVCQLLPVHPLPCSSWQTLILLSLCFLSLPLSTVACPSSTVFFLANTDIAIIVFPEFPSVP